MRWKVAIDFTVAADICTVNEMNERLSVFNHKVDWLINIPICASSLHVTDFKAIC